MIIQTDMGKQKKSFQKRLVSVHPQTLHPKRISSEGLSIETRSAVKRVSTIEACESRKHQSPTESVLLHTNSP